MVKYEIRFKLDIEEALEYDKSEQSVEIINIDDTCFDKAFDSKDKIQEFENWWNESAISEDEKIKVLDITYDRDGEDIGILTITLTSKLNSDDEKILMDESVYYLFSLDYPKIYYHVTGTSFEDYWDYHRSTPEQRTINVDYDDNTYISEYSDVSMKII